MVKLKSKKLMTVFAFIFAISSLCFFHSIVSPGKIAPVAAAEVTRNLTPEENEYITRESNVAGAKNEQVYVITNKNVTTAQSTYRFAPVYWSTAAVADVEYKLTFRFKVSADNGFVLNSGSMGSIGYFIMYGNTKNGYGQVEETSVKALVSLDGYYTEGSSADVAAGEWGTITYTVKLPATYTFNGTEEECDRLVVLIRPEMLSADNPDASLTIYIDEFSIKGVEPEEEPEPDPEGDYVEKRLSPRSVEYVEKAYGVEGALSNGVYVQSNRKVSIAQNKWRHAPVYWEAKVQPGVAYTLNLRLKVNASDGRTFTHSELGSINIYPLFYNSGENISYASEELGINFLTQLIPYITEGSFADLASGGWVTLKYKFTVPEKYTQAVIGGEVSVDTFLLLIRPGYISDEAKDVDVDVYLDKLFISGYETPEEEVDGDPIDKDLQAFEPDVKSYPSALVENVAESGATGRNTFVVSNKNVSEKQEYNRTAVSFFTAKVVPGNSYTLTVRFKVYAGTARDSVSSVGDILFDLGFTNAESFKAIGYGYDKILTGDISALGSYYTEGDAFDLINGMWMTAEYKFTVPENYLYNGVLRTVDTVMARFGLCSLPGEANDKYLVIDVLKITGKEKTPEVDPDADYEFADDRDAFADNDDSRVFKQTEAGIAAQGGKSGSLIIDQPIGANSTVSIKINSNIKKANGEWGRYFIIIKAKTAVPSIGLNDKYSGTFIALEIGSYNAALYEYVNGVGKKYDAPLSNSTDLWYCYRQSTEIVVTMRDYTDRDGVYVTVTVKGPVSQDSFVYDCPLKELMGDGFFGFEYLLHEATSESSFITLSSLTVSGVKSVQEATVDVNQLNSKIERISFGKVLSKEQYEQCKTELTDIDSVVEKLHYSQLSQLKSAKYRAVCDSVEYYEDCVETAKRIDSTLTGITTEVNSDNYNSIKQSLESISSEYEELPEQFKSSVADYQNRYDAVKLAIDSYAAYVNAKANADRVSGIISSISEEVDDSNYQSIKSALREAENAYAELTEAEKSLVTGYEKIERVQKAVSEYENACDSTDAETFACVSAVSGGAIGTALLVLWALVGFIIVRRFLKSRVK